MDNSKRLTLYIFGDSLMRGVMPDEDMNYHSSDAIGFDELAENHNIRIVNYSMPTFTSAQVRSWAMRTMERTEKPDRVLLEFGGNDCDLKWKDISEGTCSRDDMHRVAPDVFKDNYRSLIEYFIEMGAGPVIAFCPHIHVKRYLEHLFECGIDRDMCAKYGVSVKSMGEGFLQYKLATMELAEEYGCDLIDLNDNFPRVKDILNPTELDDYFSADGMHPSEKGYALFHESFDRAFTGIFGA